MKPMMIGRMPRIRISLRHIQSHSPPNAIQDNAHDGMGAISTAAPGMDDTIAATSRIIPIPTLIKVMGQASSPMGYSTSAIRPDGMTQNAARGTAIMLAISPKAATCWK